MAEKALKAICTGTLELGDRRIACAVLEDGRRVLSRRGTNVALGRGRSGGRGFSRVGEIEGGAKLPEFLGARNLKPYISDELRVALSEPIIFRPPL